MKTEDLLKRFNNIWIDTKNKKCQLFDIFLLNKIKKSIIIGSVKVEFSLKQLLKGKMMSFSNVVKQEIIKKNLFKGETKALLQGLFLACGSLIISGGSLSFVLSSENDFIIDFLKDKISERFDTCEIDVVGVMKSFKNKQRFELSVDEISNLTILKDLGIVSFNGDEMDVSDVCDRSYLKSKNSSLAFLIGVFLGAGSVSVPISENGKKKYGYHFEIYIISKNQADMIAEILSNFDIFPKMVERGDNYVLYLKNSETICDILAMFGASKVVLDLENNKVSRDMSNMANRQTNCMTANIDKTVNASLKQLAAIEIIQNTIGLENLPEGLLEAALIRLANPEASLKDLCELLEKPVSKGALAQRFNKIIQISEELGEENV